MPGPPHKEESRSAVLHVLFVEDDHADVDLSLRALKAAGFDVHADVSENAEQFRKCLRARRYDVVLSDYRLPGVTGMDCLEVLKAERVDIPFILVTGSLGDEKAVECMKEGVADFVLKDRLGRLPLAVRRALEDHRLRAERAKAEEALRRSEASYRSLIQSAPCGIVRFDAHSGYLLEANPALADLIGYDSAAELLAIGREQGIVLPPETCTRMAGEAERDCGIRELEVHWRRKDGEGIAIRLSGRLLREDETGPVCFEMIAESVTERRQAEERTRQLNRLYSVLSHAGQAIILIRERNALFREICRIIVEEGHFKMAWVGLADFEAGLIRPVTYWGEEDGYLGQIYIALKVGPTGNGPMATAIQERRRVVIDVDIDPMMLPWREEALRRGYRAVAAFPIFIRDRSVGGVAIYAPETKVFDSENLALLDKLAANVSFALESIEAEEMHRQAVDEMDQFFKLSPDMLAIVALDGSACRLNPAWEQTLGLDEDEMRSQPWYCFVHPDDRQRALHAAGELRAGHEVKRLELRFPTKDGEHRWLVASAIPVLERGLVFAAVTDISDRKYLEEQLRDQNLELEQQTRRAEAASRLKSEFLANMSHELRSPLNGIIGFTQMLYDGKLGALPDRPREYVARVEKSARHLLELINGVLDLSKVEAGRLEFQPEQVHLPQLIQEVIGVLTPLAEEKSIHLDSEIDPRIDTAVTDGQRFKQVLYNYLSNALKFTQDGGRVTVRLQLESAMEFRLEVSDTGMGIADRDIPLLFTAFQQLDSTASKRYAGTGLGLALTKQIVEAQGGRVGVRSMPGAGSTFFAVLPDASGRDVAGAPTVLVVEDERVQRFLITKLLVQAGYAVDTAKTSAEAISKCRKRRFDAITLDLMLPDASGWDALAAIRSLEQHRTTPVLVLTLVGQSGLKAPFPIQGFLSKPVDSQKLVAALELSGVYAKGKQVT
jgi:PAS domain S-box-containing protein